ncbi:hypothetical protein OGAPHI_007357 [Ogataea philodendri]|uniref:Uncharacterized protein n=1 Tax=Ogataea philodendri TaxID=1378263 RepID=A0A9P8NV04_9ASCO|nr:uncharacterized protein OGAPHI_007357 [Ogataea philodendri]KAH3660152.1 hypothetical protein OGAPHI_007357 [Ogataea philodendri]
MAVTSDPVDIPMAMYQVIPAAFKITDRISVDLKMYLIAWLLKNCGKCLKLLEPNSFSAGERSSETFPFLTVRIYVAVFVTQIPSECFVERDSRELQRPQQPPGSMGDQQQKNRLAKLELCVEVCGGFCLGDKRDQRRDKQNNNKHDLNIRERVLVHAAQTAHFRNQPGTAARLSAELVGLHKKRFQRAYRLGRTAQGVCHNDLDV